MSSALFAADHGTDAETSVWREGAPAEMPVVLQADAESVGLRHLQRTKKGELLMHDVICAKAVRQVLDGCGPGVRDRVLRRFDDRAGSFDRWLIADLERMRAALQDELSSTASAHVRASLGLLVDQLEIGIREFQRRDRGASAPAPITTVDTTTRAEEAA